jgi:HEAT repeat protein
MNIRTSGEEINLQRTAWLFSHPDREVRALAFELADQQPENRNLGDLMLREMVGKPSQIRKEIIDHVMKMEPERMGVRIAALTSSPKLDEREAGFDVIASLTRIDDMLPILKSGLRDPENAVRHRAARVLARGIKNPTIFLILKDLVRDEDEQIRHIAIHALAESEDPDIVEPFFQRLPHEPDAERQVMVRALTRLAKNPHAKIEDRIIPNLGDENPEVRDAAVALLAEMPNRTKVLRSFLLHSRSIAHWLRDRVSQTISQISRDIVEPLVELMNDPDQDVRAGAMQMAAGSKDPRILAAVRRIFLSESDWWVRVMAADVLARYPQPDIVQLLVTKMRDPELRYGIVAALGAMNSPIATPHLLECLKDPQRGVRTVALEALQKSTDPRVVAVVLELALHDPDSMVREKAEALLDVMGDVAKDARHKLAVGRHEQARQEHASLRDTPTDFDMENEALNRK